jgi:hypothetical protein
MSTGTTEKVVVALTKTRQKPDREFGDPGIFLPMGVVPSASVLIGERSPVAGCCERRCD